MDAPRRPTFTASVGLAPQVVSGWFCEVDIVQDGHPGTLGEATVFDAATDVRVGGNAVRAVRAAERIMCEAGWERTSDWKLPADGRVAFASVARR